MALRKELRSLTFNGLPLDCPCAAFSPDGNSVAFSWNGPGEDNRDIYVKLIDSGELGVYGPPTANRETWSTPSDLAPGTYTYFCRIHPFMRGAFRVVA